MKEVGEKEDMVGKETTPDTQAALASTTDGSATTAGRHLDLENWRDEAAHWLGWPLGKPGLRNHQDY